MGCVSPGGRGWSQGGVRKEEGGRKEERDIKQQAAGLIAFKAVWMMY